MDSNIELINLVVFPFNFFLFVVDGTLDFAYSGMIRVANFHKFTYKNTEYISNLVQKIVNEKLTFRDPIDIFWFSTSFINSGPSYLGLFFLLLLQLFSGLFS